MYQSLLPIIFAVSVLAAGPVPLPKNFKTCSRSSPDINGCLKSAIQDGISELAKGSRPLGVLPIDPLQITTLQIHQGTGPVAIDLDFTDLSIRGIKDVKVNSVEAELNGEMKTLNIALSLDKKLELAGKYTINGKVLVLDISGTGQSYLKFDDVSASIKFTGKTVTKDGVEYLVFTSVEFNMVPKNMETNFENLFNGNKALGDNMNKFLNENWSEVYGELKSSIEKAFGSTCIAIGNRIFTKVPFDVVFPQ